MLFKLCNASSNFQNYINKTIHEYFDVFCSIYLNNILIYNNDENKHTNQILKILYWLQEWDFYLDIDKCEFDSREMKYLDLIITSDDVKMNSEKVKAIQNWKISWNIKNMQAFLEFVNFYCWFIINFSQWTHSLTECSKSKVFLIRTEKQKIRYNLFTWTADCQKTFDDLKAVFLSASVLAHFDSNKKIWIEINVSDFVIAKILS